MPDRLLENRDSRFVSVSEFAGPYFKRRGVSRACSAGDFDSDGDLDLLITTMGGEVVLLRNDTRGGHWVGVLLEGKPPNRDGVGAKIRLVSGDRAQVRHIFAGGSYLGQRDRRQLFGLGTATRIETLHVRWPDGAETTHRDLEAGRYHAVKQTAR